MSNASSLISKFDRNSLSNRVSNMGQDRDQHISMEGLEESMMLIFIALNFARVKTHGIESKTLKHVLQVAR